MASCEEASVWVPLYRGQRHGLINPAPLISKEEYENMLVDHECGFTDLRDVIDTVSKDNSGNIMNWTYSTYSLAKTEYIHTHSNNFIHHFVDESISS